MEGPHALLRCHIVCLRWGISASSFQMDYREQQSVHFHGWQYSGMECFLIL